MESFRTVMENADHDAVPALLADDVVFHSPIADRPFRGKAVTTAIIRACLRVMTDMKFGQSFQDGDTGCALQFDAMAGDDPVSGSFFLRVDGAGLIDEVVVMLRPLSGTVAVKKLMHEQAHRMWTESKSPVGSAS